MTRLCLKMHQIASQHILRGVKCPWLTVATKKLMNERDSVLRKARRSGSEVDWSMYIDGYEIKYLTGLKLRSADIKEMKFLIIWIIQNLFGKQ